MTNNMQEMYIDTILLDVNVGNVQQAFQKLTAHVAKLIGTPEKFLMSMLMEREEKQNSGIGHGVAVLDAKLPRLTQPMIVFMKLNKTIDYQAADGEPVDMITLVLSPEFENATDYDSVRMAVKTINAQKKAA